MMLAFLPSSLPLVAQPSIFEMHANPVELLWLWVILLRPKWVDYPSMQNISQESGE